MKKLYLSTMHSSKTILNVTEHSWVQTAKEFQILRADIQQICEKMGFMQLEYCVIIIEYGQLNLQTTAALAMRLRLIKLDLLNNLIKKGWAIHNVIISIQKHNQLLQQQLYNQLWVNPNELRYGKRDLPTQKQREYILNFVQLQSKKKKL